MVRGWNLDGMGMRFGSYGDGIWMVWGWDLDEMGMEFG